MEKTFYITEEQKKAIKDIIINEERLNEAMGRNARERYVAEQITQHCNPYIAHYLNDSLSSLPNMLKQQLVPESSIFQTIESRKEGHNRLIDYLVLNFYDQFGLTRNRGPQQFIPGIARISIGELGQYSFDPNIMQGGKITKLGKLCKLLYMHPEISEGLKLDESLNNMNYDELMSIFSHRVQRYVEDTKIKLRDKHITGNHRYKVYKIEDTVDYRGIASPTLESQHLLDRLSNFSDWCICRGDLGSMEYAQYVGNGGQFYVLLRDDYQSVIREEGENCPLDDYGLSMIAVLVGTDGLPDNITTRWNHEHDGENNENLCTAEQLQDITNINYLSTFEPREKEQLRQMHIDESKVPSAQSQVHKKVNSGIMDAVTLCGTMEEGAEPESDKYEIGFEGDSNMEYGHVNESLSSEDYDFKKDMKSIASFMKDEGLKVYPYPKIKLNWEDQDGLYIKTGYYDPEAKTIVIFCNGRHPKDILRTFAHEMIHHSQNLNGEDLNFSSADNVKDNKKLEKIEAEAYLKGNVYFRKWTEHKNKKETLQESYNPSSSMEMEEDTNPEDVDLSSFNIKHNLNPKFWKDGKLDSRIRLKLLDIADDFIEFLGVDWVRPEDIIITGSLANYNWNKKYSDIDLHIIMDYSKVDKRKDFVSNYFYSQKKLWNSEHKDLKIFGFPIEIFVQDKEEKHFSTGVYSLDRNEWILEPKRQNLTSQKVSKSYIKKQVARYIDKIDDLFTIYKISNGDEYKIRKVSEKAEKLFDDIKKERAKGLNSTDNEISNGNVIFKCLRRLGYIEKLVRLRSKTYDKMNSIS